MYNNKFIESLSNFKIRKEEIQDLEVIILSNTINKTKKTKYKCQNANNNEFFKYNEFKEIVMKIQNEFTFVYPFFNELEFIHEILNKNERTNDFIVYNLSRNGIKEGKKALIPAFCDLLDIKYTGSNAFVTSLARNKYVFSSLLKQHNICVPKSYLYLKDGGWYNSEKPSIGDKLIVKFVCESASIGIDQNNIFYYDKSKDEMLNSILIKNNITQLLVQEFISGYECEVPVIIGEDIYPLGVVGISINTFTNLSDHILTSTISDNNEYEFYLLSNEKENALIENILNTTRKVVQLLGMSDIARIDFRISDDNKYYVTDIAASPYTTEHSSFQYLFSHLYNIDISNLYYYIIANKFYCDKY
jgi:D-alanine-D-alanine ligase